jgi:hypothetical protein
MWFYSGANNLSEAGIHPIDGITLEALISRVTEAKENNLALSPQDCQL